MSIAAKINKKRPILLIFWLKTGVFMSNYLTGVNLT
nr:hypothetical protein [Mucilaginibacter sp. X4EP1]